MRIWRYIVGNKVKGRISKRVFQENKARQIFRKMNISYPLIGTRTISGIVMNRSYTFWISSFSGEKTGKQIPERLSILLTMRFFDTNTP